MVEGHAMYKGKPRLFWTRVMTKSKRGERGSSSSSASSNTELTKARMNEEEEETKSLKDLNSKFNGEHQEPITWSLQLHHIPVTAFSQTDLFLVLNLSRIQIPTGTSVTNCNHKHGLMVTCRHLHVRPHCFIPAEACSCRLELAYFAGRISKNRLVCKNAVSLPYYGSYRLLVIGPC